MTEAMMERVSPEFRLRPSLSERMQRIARRQRASVAGVQTPAFVERAGITRSIRTP